MTTKRLLLTLTVLVCSFSLGHAQWKKLNKTKLLNSATKTVEALTLTDEQMAAYVQEYTTWLDAHNPICSVDDTDPGKKAVAERLQQIVATMPKIKEVKVDIQAYYVKEVNAFACPDGTIRVFAGLMQEMTDDQILGIIGHELGHIVHKDSKKAFRKSLLSSAVKDAIAASGSSIAQLTDSDLGQLAQAFTAAQYSQKAEYAADDFGYELLSLSGKDPRAMADALGVLIKLEEEAEQAGANTKLNQLFSSHPNSQKRAEVLTEKYHKENKHLADLKP